MSLLTLPDPLSGWLHERNLSRFAGLALHVAVVSLSAFLVAFGSSVTGTWVAITQNPWACLLIGLGNGCVAAGGVMLRTWTLNLPKGLKVPEPPAG